jgi:hypothetical protein
MSRADAALYGAKQAGRNCVEYAATRVFEFSGWNFLVRPISTIWARVIET